MQRYEAMKKSKGSGRAIIATARKMAVVIWNMLTRDVGFDIGLMVDHKLAKKADSMSGMAGIVGQAMNKAQEKLVQIEEVKRSEGVRQTVKNLALPEKKKLAKGNLGVDFL
jgi:hypothetical protein